MIDNGYIHDNFLLGYEVNAVKREIILKTEFKEDGAHDKVDVIFNDVAAYQFIYDSFGTILLAIEETDPIELVKRNLKQFQEGWTKAAWPGSWGQTLDGAREYIVKNNILGFEVHSSIGIYGWILAKSGQLKIHS